MERYDSPENAWMKRNQLYLLQQRSLSLERYVTALEKLVLEAGIDAVVKRDIFINELNENLLST